MQKISLENQKYKMLEILTYIDNTCEENDLKYSLWGGSLLGAVRHHGFIPWDDDVDIGLPRKDYIQLCEILKKQEKYDFLEYSIQPTYTQGWAKLADKDSIDVKKKYFDNKLKHGIYVDIMPIDGLPMAEEDIKKFKKKILKKYRIIRSSNFPSYAQSISFNDSLKKLLLGSPFKLCNVLSGGKSKMINRLDEESQTFDFYTSPNCGHLLSRYRGNLGYPKEIWSEIIDYSFEGKNFKGIKNAHLYLTILYGEDYMSIPNKEKQVTHEEHEFYKRR